MILEFIIPLFHKNDKNDNARIYEAQSKTLNIGIQRKQD